MLSHGTSWTVNFEKKSTASQTHLDFINIGFNLEWHISWQENMKQEIDDQEISCRKLGTRKTGKTRKNKGVKNQDLEPKDIYILSFSTNN